MNVIGLHPNCWRHRQAVALLAGGILEAEESAAVQAHLAACPRCRGYYTEMKSVTDGLRRSEHDLPDVPVSATTHQRWMQAILGESSARERGIRSASARSLPPLEVAARSGINSALLRVRFIHMAVFPRFASVIKRLLLRPAAAGLAIVWILILFFNLTAPVVPRIASTAVVLSPAELFAVLKAQAQEASRRFDPGESVWFEPPKPVTPRPRSESEREEGGARTILSAGAPGFEGGQDCPRSHRLPRCRAST